MNGKDGLQNKEMAKGFVMFLFSEKQRHIKDIRMIEEIICEVSYEWKISPKEIDALRKESKKYVDF